MGPKSRLSQCWTAVIKQCKPLQIVQYGVIESTLCVSVDYETFTICTVRRFDINKLQNAALYKLINGDRSKYL